MKLNICWMYHDLMNLYGDQGNIQVIKKRCEWRNIEAKVDTCSIGEDKDLSQYDLVFIGGGADQEQKLLISDLLSRKENIKQALDTNTFFLLICGGYQLFGQYYIDGDGEKINGLGLYSYESVAGTRDNRCIGNIIVEATLDDQLIKVVGFENHGGQTKGVQTPFAKVIKGHGNMYQSAYEGFYNGQVLGTYIHGPLLPKNPQIADFVIKKALSKNYGNVDLVPLDDEMENQARTVLLKRMNVE